MNPLRVRARRSLQEFASWSRLCPELYVHTSEVQRIPVAVWGQQPVHPSVLEV